MFDFVHIFAEALGKDFGSDMLKLYQAKYVQTILNLVFKKLVNISFLKSDVHMYVHKSPKIVIIILIPGMVSRLHITMLTHNYVSSILSLYIHTYKYNRIA
jgi:hypothetical protein